MVLNGKRIVALAVVAAALVVGALMLAGGGDVHHLGATAIEYGLIAAP